MYAEIKVVNSGKRSSGKTMWCGDVPAKITVSPKSTGKPGITLEAECCSDNYAYDKSGFLELMQYDRSCSVFLSPDDLQGIITAAIDAGIVKLNFIAE